MGLDAPLQRFVPLERADAQTAMQPGIGRARHSQVHPYIVRAKLIAIDVNLVNEQEKVAFICLIQLLMAARGAMSSQASRAARVVGLLANLDFQWFGRNCTLSDVVLLVCPTLLTRSNPARNRGKYGDADPKKYQGLPDHFTYEAL